MTQPNVTPVAAWTPNIPSANAFDASSHTWYKFGPAQKAPDQPLLSEVDVRWVAEKEYPDKIYAGKQYPMWHVNYYLVDGVSLYRVIPNDSYSSEVHTLTISNTPSNNACPESSIAYINKVSATHAWHLYYCKSTDLTIESDPNGLLHVGEVMLGRVPYIYNNNASADNQDTISNPLDIGASPSFVGDVTSYRLDGSTEITYEGSTWDVNLQQIKININRELLYVHKSNDTFIVEVFPSDIYEGNNIVGMYVDFIFLQSKNNTIIEDIYDLAAKAQDFNIKIYAINNSSRYIQFGVESSGQLYHSKSSQNFVNSHGIRDSMHQIRFLIDRPEIKIKDGYTSEYSNLW